MSRSASNSKTQRIDLWRHEVAQAAAATATATATASAPTENGTSLSISAMPPPPPPEQKPRHRRRTRTSLLLSKLLRSKSGGAEAEGGEEEGGFESTAMYGVMPKAGAAAGCEARATGCRMDMDWKDVCGEQEGLQSEAIADGSVSSGPGAALVARQERLERAARLLGRNKGREDKV